MRNEFIAINKKNEQIKCQIFCSIYLNNKNYIFYKDNDNNLYTGRVDNNDIKQILKNDEFENIENIFELLKGNDKKTFFIEFMSQIYNDNQYKTIYDNIEGKNFTYKMVDGKFKEISEDDKNYFNNLFNDNVNKLYSNNVIPSDIKFQKIFKINKIFAIAIIMDNEILKSFKNIKLTNNYIDNITSVININKENEI